jgi:hypothetical protein
MHEIRGRVEFRGGRPSRAFRRNVARRIEKWIEERRPFRSAPASYEAIVAHEEEAEFHWCSLRVRIGPGPGMEWVSCEGARTPHEAVTAALRELGKRTHAFSVSKGGSHVHPVRVQRISA